MSHFAAMHLNELLSDIRDGFLPSRAARVIFRPGEHRTEIVAEIRDCDEVLRDTFHVPECGGLIRHIESDRTVCRGFRCAGPVLAARSPAEALAVLRREWTNARRAAIRAGNRWR